MKYILIVSLIFLVAGCSGRHSTKYSSTDFTSGSVTGTPSNIKYVEEEDTRTGTSTTSTNGSGNKTSLTANDVQLRNYLEKSLWAAQDHVNANGIDEHSNEEVASVIVNSMKSNGASAKVSVSNQGNQKLSINVTGNLDGTVIDASTLMGKSSYFKIVFKNKSGHTTPKWAVRAPR